MKKLYTKSERKAIKAIYLANLSPLGSIRRAQKFSSYQYWLEKSGHFAYVCGNSGNYRFI